MRCGSSVSSSHAEAALGKQAPLLTGRMFFTNENGSSPGNRRAATRKPLSQDVTLALSQEAQRELLALPFLPRRVRGEALGGGEARPEVAGPR